MILRVFLVLVITLSCASVRSADIVIHTAPPSENIQSNDTRLLANIFTRKITRWLSNGQKITVFTRPLNSIEHKLFVIYWLGLTHYRYKKLLKQNTFSGAASSVKTITSDEIMLLTITKTPNSIGYISKFMVLNNDSTITYISIN